MDLQHEFHKKSSRFRHVEINDANITHYEDLDEENDLGWPCKFSRFLIFRLQAWLSPLNKQFWLNPQLFLQFHGPATLLVQSRASRVNDILTNEQVNEIADAPPGTVKAAVDSVTPQTKDEAPKQDAEQEQVRQSIASVKRDGKVEFQRPEEAQGSSSA